MINHNGFAVKHPDLRPQAAWNNDPPSIDILDLEAVKTDDLKTRIGEVGCCNDVSHNHTRSQWSSLYSELGRLLVGGWRYPLLPTPIHKKLAQANFESQSFIGYKKSCLSLVFII